MRPKTVILVLVVAVGLVALAAVMRGVLGARVDEVKAPPPPVTETPPPSAVNEAVNPNSSNTAAILEQLRAAERVKELDQVRELMFRGVGDPMTAELLLGKVAHQDMEVRKAAAQALMQLNATNTIPGLEQALAQTQDPGEKVGLIEVINYLKLPEDAPPPPASSTTAGTDPLPPPSEVAPAQKKDPSAPRAPRERKAKTRPRRAVPLPAASPPTPVSAQPQ